MKGYATNRRAKEETSGVSSHRSDRAARRASELGVLSPAAARRAHDERRPEIEIQVRAFATSSHNRVQQGHYVQGSG